MWYSKFYSCVRVCDKQLIVRTSLNDRNYRSRGLRRLSSRSLPFATHWSVHLHQLHLRSTMSFAMSAYSDKRLRSVAELSVDRKARRIEHTGRFFVDKIRSLNLVLVGRRGYSVFKFNGFESLSDILVCFFRSLTHMHCTHVLLD